MSRHLSSSCTIMVDDDGQKWTGYTIKECLPCGYQEVQTSQGDMIFGRDVFSCEKEEEEYVTDGWYRNL